MRFPRIRPSRSSPFASGRSGLEWAGARRPPPGALRRARRRRLSRGDGGRPRLRGHRLLGDGRLHAEGGGGGPGLPAAPVVCARTAGDAHGDDLRRGCARPRRRVRGAGGAARLRRGPRHHARRDAARDGGPPRSSPRGGRWRGWRRISSGRWRRAISSSTRGRSRTPGALELYSGRRPALLDARRSVLGIGATYPDAAEDVLGCGRPGPRVAVRPARLPRDAARARAERRRHRCPPAPHICWRSGTAAGSTAMSAVGDSDRSSRAQSGCGTFAFCATVSRCAFTR
jgi:hypothetical protein